MEITRQEKNFDYRDTYVLRFIIGAAAFVLFLIVLNFYLSGRSLAYDERICAWARSIRTPALNSFMISVTQLGAWYTIVGITVVITIMDLTKWHQPEYPLAVAGCLSILGLYQLIKIIVARPRQDAAFWLVIEHGYSFPSGHTMNSTFCYGMMLYLLLRNCPNDWIRRIFTVVICLIIPLIAFSRVYCGVHYPTDVMAGSLLSFSLLMFTTVFIDEVQRRNAARHDR